MSGDPVTILARQVQGGAARFVESDPYRGLGPFSTVMVGLWLEREAAEALALPEYQPAESLHLTLCELGEAAGYDELEIAHILVAVEMATTQQEPLTGEVSGIGRFFAEAESDGRDVIWAAPAAPGLTELRQRIVEYLPARAREAARGTRWQPHITLAYVEPGAVWPVEALPAVALRFSEVTVAVAGATTVVPLFRPDRFADVTHLARDGGASRLFNEVPALGELPAEVPVLPKPGVYQHPVYGEIAMTVERIGRFVANHNARVYQRHIPIDAEHETQLSGALGYLGEMSIKGDGSAWAAVEWTDRGRALIGGGRFRYVSPTLLPSWTDPGSGERHEDVLIGLACTTRPFFKEGYLAPLVASEAGLMALDPRDPVHGGFIELPRQVGGEEPMGDETQGADSEVAEPMSTGMAAGEEGQAFGELQQRFAELEQRYAAVEARAVAAEGQATAAEERAAEADRELEGVRAAQREQAFRDEVLGRVDGGVRWFGDVDAHLLLLKALPTEESRQLYIEGQRAHARQLEEAIREPVRGSSLGRGDSASAVETEVAGRVRSYREQHPEATEEQAFVAVLGADPALRQRYREAQAV